MGGREPLPTFQPSAPIGLESPNFKLLLTRPMHSRTGARAAGFLSWRLHCRYFTRRSGVPWSALTREYRSQLATAGRHLLTNDSQAHYQRPSSIPSQRFVVG